MPQSVFNETTIDLTLFQDPLEPVVIYRYPMFPPKENSALVKKDMRILQEVGGQENAADDLFTVALPIATNRVVVKRPAYADFLAEIKPQTSIKSQNTDLLSIFFKSKPQDSPLYKANPSVVSKGLSSIS
ncbi:class I SAM-dependent methyltransferase [Nitrospira sp. M1]